MSRFFLGVVLVALLVPLATRGSYRRLFLSRFPWFSLLVGGVALQFLVDRADPPAEGVHQVGWGMLVASYVLVLGFTARNVVKRGMATVAIGIAANFLAILANQGMPVDVPPDWQQHGAAEATVKHHPQAPDDRLLFLSDIIVLRSLDEVISFGDLIMAFGLIDVAFHASRGRRSRTRTGSRPGETRTATAERPVDEPTEDATMSERAADDEWLELDLTDEEPRPPSPVVAGVIEELAALRRAARQRHPSARFARRSASVGRGARRASEAKPEILEPGVIDETLEPLEHASVIHISGAGVQRFERETGV